MTEDSFNREQKAFWRDEAMTEKARLEELRAAYQNARGNLLDIGAINDLTRIENYVDALEAKDQKLAELKQEIAERTWIMARQKQMRPLEGFAEYWESESKKGSK